MLQLLRDGDLYIWALVATSVVALAMTLERAIALRWGRIIPARLLEELDRFTRGGSAHDLERATLQYDSPIGRLLRLGIENARRPREETHDAIETRARREVSRLERGIVVLEIIVGIAPLLGLVGTIHGLITLFGDLGQMGLGDSSVFARGIAIALNATLLGLLVAIPSLIFWSYYSRKIETMAIEMEAACAELLEHLYPRGEAAAAKAAPAPAPAPSRPR